MKEMIAIVSDRKLINSGKQLHGKFGIANVNEWFCEK